MLAVLEMRPQSKIVLQECGRTISHVQVILQP